MTPATADRRMLGTATVTSTPVYFQGALYIKSHVSTTGALSIEELSDRISGNIATLLRPLVIRCVGAVATGGPLAIVVL